MTPKPILSTLNLSFEKIQQNYKNVLYKFPESKIKSSSKNYKVRDGFLKNLSKCR